MTYNFDVEYPDEPMNFRYCTSTHFLTEPFGGVEYPQERSTRVSRMS